MKKRDMITMKKRDMITARKRIMGDIRGIPTPICPFCQSTLINITASFNPETYEIEMYLLDNATCSDCGAFLTAPTPADLPLS
jgi:hypothetical protein